MKAFDPQKNILGLILLKQIQNFCMSLHFNTDNSYLFVNGKDIFKLNPDNKNVNFPNQFCQFF